MSACVLDPVTQALVSLAAFVAANHPSKGRCQLERLRQYGVEEARIDLVIEIARHLRDEAGQVTDHAFDTLRADLFRGGEAADESGTC
ncbi:MAG: hypothetical protein ACOY4H_06725 [Thermodesulfobacteriota bacterium]